MSVPLLKIDQLAKSFKGLRAVDGVSIEVPEGKIYALIGPNGAGKTTIFNMIAGVFAPTEGQVLFGGQDITGLRPDQVCQAGIGRTFQVVKPFNDLSVLDNVLVGALRKTPHVDEAREAASTILKQLGLDGKSQQMATNLTLPERKRLEVARALATGPQLLLLDEVMAGLRPTETDEMVTFFRNLNKETGITILLIEHVMRAVMALSERVYVVNYGQLLSQGTPDEVVNDQAVLDCYLGEDAF
ncbi:MAG: ABC transporter ATP-binding protein [Alphaproteobacteria bacterium]|nr:ABC transporter ATP-binding protein [Rhodospirillales bacterium]MCW9044709.1 ABC transporter ATP-binding protein [Alphaproteobacteria bacterium]